MLHTLFIVMAIVAGWAAYAEGMIPMETVAIGSFFAAYACCMGMLFREQH